MQPRTRSSQTGSVLVEAAFTLLALFVFLLGIMEAGRFFQVQQFLTDAAREGARYAVTPSSGSTTLPSSTAVTGVVDQYLAAAGITSSDRTVSVDTVSLSDATSACTSSAACGTKVTVSYPYQIMTLAMFTNLKFTLKGKALMRNETSP